MPGRRFTRVAVATVLGTAVALAGIQGQSAQAGDPNRVTVYHNLRDALAPVSEDCTGTPTDAFSRRFRPFAAALHGTGALHITDTGRSKGGVVVAGTTGLPRTVWPVYPVAAPAATPRARWVVEFGSDRLHSDTIDLVPNRWNKPAIADVQLTDGTFTGTVQEYFDQFGVQDFKVSLYTGGCLRSPDVWVDDITMKSGFPIFHTDPEPQVWLDSSPISQYVHFGQTARLTSLLNFGEVDGTYSTIAGVHLGLFRRLVGKTTWTRVATATSAHHSVHRDPLPDRTAFYQWRYAGGQTPQAPYSVASPASKVTVQEVLHTRPADVTLQPGKRLVFTGHVRPDTAGITLQVVKVGSSHPVYAFGHTAPDRSFHISMRMPDRGSFSARIFAGPDHFRAWAVTTSKRFPVTVG